MWPGSLSAAGLINCALHAQGVFQPGFTQGSLDRAPWAMVTPKPGQQRHALDSDVAAYERGLVWDPGAHRDRSPTGMEPENASPQVGSRVMYGDKTCTCNRLILEGV